MDVAQARGGQLVSGIFKAGGARALDMLLMLLQPYFQAGGFLLTSVLLLSQPRLSQALALLPLSLLAGFLAMAVFARILTAIQGGKADYRVIFLFPLFMASWLPLNLVSLVSRTRSWQEIEHGKRANLPAIRVRDFAR